MAATYTSNLRLSKPGNNDRAWDATLNADLDQIDGLAPVGSLAVTATEAPSATLHVRVTAGTFLRATGAYGTYAGASPVTVPASATTYLWLDDSGTLVQGTAWPASNHVRLAIVTTSASAIVGAQDARVAASSAGSARTTPTVTVTAAYTITAADGVIRCDATAGAFTVTLPAASTVPGLVVRAKKIDSSSNVVTISGAIDGASSVTLATQYASKTFVADGPSNTWGAY